MGGELKKGYCVIGGVVPTSVKEFFDKMVKDGKFESRSKAIGKILTDFANAHKIKQEEGGKR